MSKTITKDEFDRFMNDDSISKKEYDAIESKINARFYDIVATIIGKENLSWVDYTNGDSSAEIDGWFDRDFCRDGIAFEGEGKNSKGQRKFEELQEAVNYSLPLEWLWEEDFKEQYYQLHAEIKKEEENRKARARKKRDARKQRLEKLQASIKKKLTKEELSAINFKK